ncbi:MAG: glycosyltransferase family 4 protein [Paludibacter sp.]|nr:glycosyltransferase family 4 protein [Paludibacter sp.]
MKLLYCVPALHNAGGMERVLTEKVNYLAEHQNYEITIVTTDQGVKPIYFQLDKRIHVIHLNIDFNSHFAVNLLKKYLSHKQKIRIYKLRLTELIIELKIDICISLCGKEIDFLYALPVQCKKVAEIHFSMNNRMLFMTSHNKGILWKVLGKIRTQQLLNAVSGLDKLVVLTKVDQSQWKKSHIETLQIPNPNPLNNIEVSLLNNNRVISVGRLDQQKGYDMLIDSWAIVSLRHPDWILDIFGTGELENILKARIIEQKLVDKIVLRGLTSDVVTNYLESSIYVMSSRYEGLPMVLIEAMSCGLPIISFDCECGPREIISDSIDGFLIEPLNIKALADKISYLIENDKLRKEMGKNALDKAKKFSIDTIMPQWITLFDELMYE